MNQKYDWQQELLAAAVPQQLCVVEGYFVQVEKYTLWNLIYDNLTLLYIKSRLHHYLTGGCGRRSTQIKPFILVVVNKVSGDHQSQAKINATSPIYFHIP